MFAQSETNVWNQKSQSKSKGATKSSNRNQRTPLQKLEVSVQNKVEYKPVQIQEHQLQRKNVIKNGFQLSRTPLEKVEPNVPGEGERTLVHIAEDQSKHMNVVQNGFKISRHPLEKVEGKVPNSVESNPRKSLEKVEANVPIQVGSKLMENSNVQLEQKKAVASGSQVARNPLENVEVNLRKNVESKPRQMSEDQLKQKNRITTGTQLSRTPSEKIKVNVPKNIKSQPMQISEDQLKQNSIIATGSQLPRTPLENIEANVPKNAESQPMQTSNYQRKQISTNTTGGQIKRTPLDKVVVVESQPLKASNDQVKHNNVITTGSQIPRTPCEKLEVDMQIFHKPNNVRDSKTFGQDEIEDAILGNGCLEINTSKMIVPTKMNNTIVTSKQIPRTPLDEEEKTMSKIVPGQNTLALVNAGNGIETGKQLARTPQDGLEAVTQQLGSHSNTVATSEEDMAYVQHKANVEMCKKYLDKTVHLQSEFQQKRQKIEMLEYQGEISESSLKHKNDRLCRAKSSLAQNNEFESFQEGGIDPKTVAQSVNMRVRKIMKESEQLAEEIQVIKRQKVEGDQYPMWTTTQAKEDMERRKTDLEKRIREETEKLVNVANDQTLVESQKRENQSLLQELRILQEQSKSKGRIDPNGVEKNILRRVEMYLIRYESLRRTAKMLNKF
uniref:Uncharacterized protein n=1 Tax=Aplanochytrium stocchinoi TaxID=215587 RepID=A0A7S3LL62_9STRA